LNTVIQKEKLSGDALNSTIELRNELQKKKDAISEVLNRTIKKAEK